MIQIDDFLLSDDIFTRYFACDISMCHGACCVEGDSGAPLGEGEAEELEKCYGSYSPYLGRKAKEAIEKQGFSVLDRDGDTVTPLVDGRQCAYSVIEKGVTMCAVEKAFLEGKCSFRKPVSCHLYPIRVKRLGNVMTGLNLHAWDVCRAAVENGKAKGIRVYQALEEPLRRVYGDEFYTKVLEAARLLENENKNR